VKIVRFARRRQYIEHGLALVDFFDMLNTASVRYVLLRWWKTFPFHEPDEDLDILIHADDLPILSKFLSARKRGVKCDIYTHDGTNMYRKQKGPYFPIKLALDALNTRVLHADIVYIPSPKMYFATLAFHALFHKGQSGGLFHIPTMGSHTVTRDHDYIAELASAAAASGVEVRNINAVTINSWLKENGYGPSLDMLSKLVERRPELETFAELHSPQTVMAEGEVFLLVVRALGGRDRNYIAKLLALLAENQLEVLHVLQLSEPQIAAASTFRGGNWGRGPYPQSGGSPHSLIIGYDWYPTPPAPGNRHPLLRNANLTILKNDARNLFNGRQWPWRYCNVVHSPDNEQEALEYLERINDDAFAHVAEESRLRKARFSPNHEIIRTLSQGRRARTDLIRFRDSVAIKKTYKIGLERFALREQEARRLFAQEVPMPSMVDAGEGYVVIEYLENARYLELAKLSRSEKRRVSKFFISCVRSFWSRAYFQADFSPKNFLVTEDQRIFLIDFEFLQPYKKTKPSFERAYEFCGSVPGSEEYDFPIVSAPKNMTHWNWRSLPFKKYVKPLIA
jgi:hypothetical protein